MYIVVKNRTAVLSYDFISSTNIVLYPVAFLQKKSIFVYRIFCILTLIQL